jgi:hypothetical protein
MRTQGDVDWRGWGSMPRRAVLTVLCLNGIGGCVAPAAAPAPRTGEGAQLAPTMVIIGDREYLGSVSGGPDGLVLTAQGAEAVSGASISVSRPGLGNADGIEAKTAAAGICAQAGGRHDPRALGRFVPSDAVDGSWVFDGACG